jgi:hypothetical protein
MMGKRQLREIIIYFLLGGLLLYLLWWRLHVSSIRFFDIDEFSYMHWTAEVARGEHMYTDFFSYFTPGFMWVMAPIFWVYGVSAQVFMAGRAVSFAIFLGILGSLGYLFGITRGWKWALLPAVILAFLPMPYDKFLEIRPDNLSTLLAILGVIGEIRAIRGKNIWWFVSGLAYSASLFVLAKTLPIVVVGAGIAFLSSRKQFKYFLLALISPWVLFFVGAYIGGHFSQVWYSVTRLPFEVYESVKNYPMEADLFFFPNVSFYGISPGITMGLIVNHMIWILAVLIGTYRFVTPFREGNREKALVEILLGGIFFVSVFGYVKFFPLKHSQYLIPIAVFVAYHCADGLSVFFDWLARAGGYESLIIVLMGFSYLLITVTKEVNAPKLLNTNTMQRTELALLLRTITLSARVVDLEGRMVFWPEGYPLSSISIDSALEFVTNRPLPLFKYLEQRPADYIWDGDSGRLGTLTADNIAYIHDHFAPVPGWAGRLWKRK